MNTAEALIERWKRVAELAVETRKPAPRPWQPGDPAVTDAYTQGRTKIRLVEKEHPGDCRYWLVSPGDGRPYGLLYEDEFRRLTPDEEKLAGLTYVELPPLSRVPGEPIWDHAIPKPAPKREWKVGDEGTCHGERFIVRKVRPERPDLLFVRWPDDDDFCGSVAVAHAIPLTPEPIREPVISRRADLVADLRTGGIDAVRKHLPALLQSYGITREEASEIIAQVEKGEWMARFGGVATGLQEWAESSNDHRLSTAYRDGSLEAWLTVLPSLAAKHVTFLVPGPAVLVKGLIDAALRDPRNDAIVDRGGLSYGLGSDALARLQADVAAFDAADCPNLTKGRSDSAIAVACQAPTM